MTSRSSRDLGHGVCVRPADGDGIVVLSEALDLGWRTREPDRPGSAVMWEGSGFEVVDRQPWRRGDRWNLEPWRGQDVMRVVSPLDQAAVSSIAEVAGAAAEAERLRPVLWLLAPVLGFAVASWQRRWRDRWNFPAAVATTLSAVLEMVFGAACLVEIIAAVGAGATIFPWIPRPLAFFGLYLFVEGFVRLAQVSADAEPIGTLIGAVVSLLRRNRPPASQAAPTPHVRSFDEGAKTVEIQSPIYRRDWEHPGLLPYRGGFYALESTGRSGEEWVYSFRRIDLAGKHMGPRLRLMPPRVAAEQRSFSDSPGMVRTVLLSIACTLAPARFQERWAWEIGGRAGWFTVMGASAELMGGLGNLSSGAGGDGLALWMNLFFIFEAIARIGWVALKKGPLGGVLGLPLAPILERFLPEPQPLTGGPEGD